MKFLLASTMAAAAYAACPNDCAGHGVCGDATQCECYRNWFGADCSERICTYSLAFVDTPIGDLNGDGMHGPARYFDPRQNNQVYGIDWVSGGTSELYAWQYGYARSDRTTEHDEAHFYRECANKGTCDRTTGLCNCFPGYNGEGCTRTACPLDCSGHGRCRTLHDNAWEASYSAWDLDHTAKCVCDPGYEGPACSLRSCPRGADPVKYALAVTNSVQGIFWATFNAAINDKTEALAYAKDKPSTVFYTLTYTDEFGDEFVTSLLSVEYHSECTTEKCITTPDFKVQTAEEHAESVNKSLGALSLGAIENKYVSVRGWNLDKDAMDGSIDDTATSYPAAADDTSPLTDALQYRLDAEVIPESCVRNPDNPGISFDGNDAAQHGLCVFVQIENPGVQAPLRVQYFYTPKTTIEDVVYEFSYISGETSAFHTGDIKDSDGNKDSADYEVDTADALYLVTVEDLNADREWNPKDGDVELEFLQVDRQSLDVCSARGLCDYDTGLCDCFSGYSGIRCDDQNAIAYSY